MSKSPSLRPTWAEIDLEAIRHNVRVMKAHVGNHRRFFATVKSNAYGHGVIPVAKAAYGAGADTIAVATSDEGLSIRETSGFEHIPLLVYGPVLPSEAPALIKENIAFSVGSNALLKDVIEAGRSLGILPKVHFQIDTGIGRDGVRFEDLQFIETLETEKFMLEGLWTHFAVSDSFDEDDIVYTRIQNARLLAVAEELKRLDQRPLLHSANSGAILRHPETWLDAIRPGISLYGCDPAGPVEKALPLRQAMSVKSQLCAIKTMMPGDTVSYGRSWEVTTPTRIGIVPIGYGDGYLRALSNKMDVLVSGKRVPIRGRVCMDQIMVDLTGIPEANIGTEVVIYGSQGDASIRLEEVAEVGGTIPYELCCILAQRVPRVYLNKEPTL